MHHTRLLSGAPDLDHVHHPRDSSTEMPLEASALSQLNSLYLPALSHICFCSWTAYLRQQPPPLRPGSGVGFNPHPQSLIPTRLSPSPVVYLLTNCVSRASSHLVLWVLALMSSRWGDSCEGLSTAFPASSLLTGSILHTTCSLFLKKSDLILLLPSFKALQASHCL